MSVGGQGVGVAANLEVEVGQFAVLTRSDLQETCGLVEATARSFLISTESVCV